MKLLLTATTMIMFLTGCFSTGIINLQTGNSLAKQEWTGDKNSFTIPFEWLDGHIIIDVTINNKQKLKLALDSGASATVLFDTSRTDGLSIDVERQLDLQGINVNVVNNVNLTVGHILLSDLTVIHVPIAESPLFQSYEAAYFDGAIGFDILNHFITTINYADKSVTFWRKNSMQLNKGEWQVLAMQIQSRIPYINIKLKDDSGLKKSYQFAVDTGAPDYLYLNDQLAKGFSFPENSFDCVLENFEGKNTKQTSRIAYAQLASTEFFDVAAHNIPSFKDEYGIGLIGSGLLRNFDVHFNYHESTIAFRKNRSFTQNTLVDRSGIALEPHILGGIVQEVAPKSPAHEIGIAANAIVTKINGISLNTSNFDTLSALLSSSKKSIDICWLKNSKEQCHKLYLVDRI